MTIAAPNATEQLGDPLHGQETVDSRVPAEISETLRAQLGDVPVTLDPLGDFRARLSSADLGRVTIGFTRLGTPTRITAGPCGDTVSWILPLAPSRVDLGSGLVVTGAPFTLSPDEDTSWFPHPHQGFVIVSTTAPSLTRLLGEHTGRPLPDFRVRRDAPLTDSDLVDAAWRAAARMLRARRPLPDITVAALEQLLLQALLIEVPSNLDPAGLGVGRSTHGHVHRAVEWITERAHQPVTVTAWASAVGVSPRYLQRIFRETYGISPHQFLHQLRLDRAHHLLHTGRVDSVAEAANQSGFAHMGRFAASYREMYGEYPSEVIRQRSPRED